MLFWTATDVERTLVEFPQYYYEHRTHAARAGCPPAPSLDPGGARASLRAYRWQPHCRAAVSHAEGRVTPSIRSAFTAAIYEFATHKYDAQQRTRQLRQLRQRATRPGFALVSQETVKVKIGVSVFECCKQER